MSDIIIDGTGGGTFVDQPGLNQITFGANASTLAASQGADTVFAGGGSLLVDASGNTNPISIQGAAGRLIYAGGPGAATITGGAGAVVVLPGNGPITLFTGGVQPIDIYSSAAWSGYYELTPTASDTLTIALDELGAVDVVDAMAGKTLVVDQGFAYFQDDPSTYLDLHETPVTITGLVSGSPGSETVGGLTTIDQTPVLAGTAPPKSTITITDATGVQVGERVTADAAGAWRALLSMLPFGTSDLAASASSFAGGPSFGVAPALAAVDVVSLNSPTIDGFSDLVGPHTGSGDTIDRRPEISGATQSGTTVQVFAAGVLLGDAVVTDTTWVYDPSGDLPMGALALTAVATDTASGAVSAASDPLTLTVHPAPPTVDTFTDTVGTMPGGNTLDHRPVLSGTAPDGTTVTVYDGGLLLGAASVAGGAWSLTPTADLADGAHDITAVAADTLTGAVSAPSADLALTIDPGAPVLTGLAGASGADLPGASVGDLNLVLSGTTDPGTSVTVSDGATELGSASVSGSSWSFTLPGGLAYGPHDLTAIATDPSDGHMSTASAPFDFVQTPPAPTITGLTPETDTGSSATDGITSNTSPVIVGTAVAGDLVTVYDGGALLDTVTAGSDGTWQLTPAAPLAYGPHILTATDSATDGSGTTSASGSPDLIVVVPSSPVITMLDGSGPGGPLSARVTANAHPTLSGSGPIGSIAAIYDGSTLIAESGTIGPDGTWTVGVPDAFSARLHILTAKAVTDGVASEPSATLSLVVNPPPSASAASADPFAAAIRSSVVALLSSSSGADNAVIYPQPGEPTVTAGAGNVQGLSIDDSMSGQTISVPADTAFVSNIASGPVTVFGSDAGNQVAVSTGGDLTYVAGRGSGVLLADQSTGRNVVFGSGSTGSDLLAATGAGDDIFVTRSSDDSLSGGAGANQFWLGSGRCAVHSDGADTIVAGSGSLTVTGGADTTSAAGTHSDLVFGGSGELEFTNLVGGSTVVGGAGSATLVGGQGDSLFFGGAAGGNVLVGGSGPATLFGGGDGDVLFAQGSHDTILVAKGDNATLAGGASTGNNLYFGGSSHNVIAAGAGNDTIGGGDGQSTIFAGAGNDLVFCAKGGGDIVAGSGNATLVGGDGPELYGFFNGRAGGDVTIYNFRSGTDHLTLQGYTGQSVAESLLGQADGSGSAQLLLSDGTRITFVGVSNLLANDLV